MHSLNFKKECSDLCRKLKANPKVRYVGKKPSRYNTRGSGPRKPTHFWITDNVQDDKLRVFITYLPNKNSMFVEIDSTYNAMLAREDNGQRVFNTHAIKEGHTVEGTTKSKLTSMADKSNHPERFHNLIYDMFN